VCVVYLCVCVLCTCVCVCVCCVPVLCVLCTCVCVVYVCVCCVPVCVLCTCVCVLCTCVCVVPDVAVEDFSECVENTNHRRHGAEEHDSSHRSDALQHRVDPDPRHLVDPAGPEREREIHVSVLLPPVD